MEYQVPQFIEVEDKIFGPFTFKQFVYVAGGIGLCAILVLYVPMPFGIVLAIPVAAFSAALAFYKVNNKNFVEVLEAGFKYYTAGRLYLWKREPKVSAPTSLSVAPERVIAQGLSRSRLQDLAWSLDIKDATPEEPKR